MVYFFLKECSKISRARTKNFNIDNYVTTENMLPDKGGIIPSQSIPDSKTLNKYEVGDILLSNIRPYFKKIWYATREGACSNDVLVIKANDNTDSEFLYYALSDNNFFNYDYLTSKGTKMPRGTPNAIMRYLVPNISSKDQRQIANLLSNYDSLVENNKKRISILESIVEQIYKEWFVRFRYPNFKNDHFINGIPSNWTYRKFSEIFHVYRGVSYSSDEIDVTVGENLVNLKNMNAFGGFRRDGTKKYDGKYKKEQVVRYKDLIMGVTDMTQERRTVGSVALIPNIDGVISADLIKLVSKINNVFSYCMFRFGFYSKLFSQFGNGANVIHLKPSSIRNQKMLIPTNSLINEFVSHVEPMIDTIENLNVANDNLVKQRDMLLPRLMSGKLDVRGKGIV
jgi:type I restriction enzyme S subunit